MKPATPAEVNRALFPSAIVTLWVLLVVVSVAVAATQRAFYVASPYYHCALRDQGKAGTAGAERRALVPYWRRERALPDLGYGALTKRRNNSKVPGRWVLAAGSRAAGMATARCTVHSAVASASNRRSSRRKAPASPITAAVTASLAALVSRVMRSAWTMRWSTVCVPASGAASTSTSALPSGCARSTGHGARALGHLQLVGEAGYPQDFPQLTRG
jgi:hypothetical protein